jgi:hypothetical protein
MAPVRVNKLAVLLALSLFAAAGCARGFDAELAEAERLRAEAAAAGFEWLETRSLLEQARYAADNGDLDEGSALVEKARFQAVMAIEQAEREAEAWRGRVVR